MSSNSLETPGIPVLGDAPADAPKHKFILRPMRFSDIHTLGVYTAEAYAGTPVMDFLAQKAHHDHHIFIRGFRQNIWERITSNQHLNLVACVASDPNTPIGYGQFVRKGNATNYSQSSGVEKWIMLLLSWVIGAYFLVEHRLWPNLTCDKDALKMFEGSSGLDTKRYWTAHPERANRWHAQSIIVAQKWQGKGVGRLILSEALSRAKEENVVMGLTSSPMGEKLYRKMGFQMLGDYTYRVGGDVGGGIMMWSPQGTEDVKSK
ncbi:uncharacterized protein LY89DRAFT_377540 [Mollisia scopiformis]|uniref:N-acetyltransferase domain-containing protein n=1 Tax=Mollisia scopiformis TaxID=149040 RepID=A0A194XN02_MOLSC|nr:uncharacterized protein LY89DRAFT_377540 [Mollisia scopiformis]KUJ21538.1 hypothetical protein LY89DRAFT_377540 [Mollisia scopiformis]